MSNLAGNKWAVTAGIIILAALFLTEGGISAVGPLLRIFLPVIVVLFAFRMVKARFRGMMDEARKNMGQPGQDPRARGGRRGAGGDGGMVIDLCPKCGSYLQKGHRCAT